MSKLGVKGGASSGERRYTMRQREVRRGKRGGELYLPFRSSLLIGVLIESASKRATTPTLEILSLVCVEDERRTKRRNTVRIHRKKRRNDEKIDERREYFGGVEQR